MMVFTITIIRPMKIKARPTPSSLLQSACTIASTQTTQVNKTQANDYCYAVLTLDINIHIIRRRFLRRF